ncbi:hypothetical protein BH24ACI2_BH24ACI2_11920 [soil metagenome]
MLKKLVISTISILLFFSLVFSQNTKRDLTEKAYTLYQQGKFEKAIETAEKVVELEKSTQSKDTVSYVNALVNLARMKRGYIIELQNKVGEKNMFASERVELYKKISQIASETETLLRQALQLNETGGKAETAQTADIKSELALLLQNYNPTAAPTVESSRRRIDEAEKLLAESLLINEQVRGKEDDKTLFVVLQTGDFYLKYVNFEKALPYYERYIQTTENTHGKNYPELINALRPYASILFTTFQDKESADIVKRIEQITQKKEESKSDNLNFHLRSKDSVAFAVRVVQSFRSDTEGFRNKLKAEGRTLNRNNIDSSPKSIRVPVKVVIDENGKVIEAIADSKDERLRVRAEQEVSKWSVRPFSYNGVTRKMRGYLTYLEVR